MLTVSPKTYGLDEDAGVAEPELGIERNDSGFVNWNLILSRGGQGTSQGGTGDLGNQQEEDGQPCQLDSQARRTYVKKGNYLEDDWLPLSICSSKLLPKVMGI